MPGLARATHRASTTNAKATDDHWVRFLRLAAILAGVPSKPVDVPLNDPSVTNDKIIKVTFADPEPEDNGSALLSYELQMDDGITGDFVTIMGGTANSL